MIIAKEGIKITHLQLPRVRVSMRHLELAATCEGFEDEVVRH
jgi:hypothetical protein